MNRLRVEEVHVRSARAAAALISRNASGVRTALIFPLKPKPQTISASVRFPMIYCGPEISNDNTEPSDERQWFEILFKNVY